ncbi:MAG: 2-oxoacid:acceptor oxidoreductase family protein, partial [Halocynthiibacter sp.]
MAITKAKPAVAESKKPEAKPVVELKDHVVEIISDSGEGAQKCAQSFATIAAKSGNSVWTVEIIPAEIQPPARSIAGASGNRIRVGSYEVTNGGDETDLAIAFNEQVILGRIREKTLKKGCTILLEDKWRVHRDEAIVKSYVETYERLIEDGFKVIEVPMEVECLKLVSNPRRGKNMFVLGMLCSIYSFDLEKGRTQIASIFAYKGEKVIKPNIALLEAGFKWAEENLEIKYRIPATKFSKPQVVMDGNTATGLGVLASGMEVCAMYPITPATSASHYLADVFENVG